MIKNAVVIGAIGLTLGACSNNPLSGPNTASVDVGVPTGVVKSAYTLSLIHI